MHPFQKRALARDRVVPVAGRAERVVGTDAELLSEVDEAINVLHAGRRGAIGKKLCAGLHILANGIAHCPFH